MSDEFEISLGDDAPDEPPPDDDTDDQTKPTPRADE
jgi:hypothetical protein